MYGYDTITLQGTKQEVACTLMENLKFPQSIINDFYYRDIIYMSKPDGSVTTELPDIVEQEMRIVNETGLVYHVIAGYATSGGITFWFYNLLYAKKGMTVLDNYSWIYASVINVNIPEFSEWGTIRISPNNKGMKRIR